MNTRDEKLKQLAELRAPGLAVLSHIQQLKGEKGDKGDTGAQGPQGVKGDKGDTGETGARGEKGDTGAAGRDGRHGIDGVAGKDGKDGKNGKDARVIDPQTIIDAVVKDITSGKRIKAEHVDGLVGSLAELKNYLKLGGFRGGGDTVVAGTGVTITVDINGHKTINASGGSTNSADISSQCDGNTKIFTIPAFTTIVSVMGSDAPIVYRPTTDFTAAGTTLTLAAGVNAPSLGATLIITYV